MPVTSNFSGDGKSRTFQLAEAVSSADSILGVTVDGEIVCGVTVDGKFVHASSITVDGKSVTPSVEVAGTSVTLPSAPANKSTVAITHLSAAIDGTF